jgi:hypothetical protein
MIGAEGDMPGQQDIGNAPGLSAENLDDAEAEVREQIAPEGAKLLKLRDEGRVVRLVWLDLNA